MRAAAAVAAAVAALLLFAVAALPTQDPGASVGPVQAVRELLGAGASGSEAAAAAAAARRNAAGLPLLTPTKTQLSTGHELFYESPPRPVGLLLILHKCGRSGSDHWPRSQPCPDCLGAPLPSADVAAPASPALLAPLPVNALVCAVPTACILHCRPHTSLDIRHPLQLA